MYMYVYVYLCIIVYMYVYVCVYVQCMYVLCMYVYVCVMVHGCTWAGFKVQDAVEDEKSEVTEAGSWGSCHIWIY